MTFISSNTNASIAVKDSFMDNQMVLQNHLSRISNFFWHGKFIIGFRKKQIIHTITNAFLKLLHMISYFNFYPEITSHEICMHGRLVKI